MSVPYFYRNTNSRFMSLEGKDSYEFLQNLITNDINKCNKENFLYSCLLTPQGKFISDFFIFTKEKNIILEIHSSFYEKLLKILNLYKLRSKIVFNEITNMSSYLVFGNLKKEDIVVVLLHDSGSRYIGKIYNDEWMKKNKFL